MGVLKVIIEKLDGGSPGLRAALFDGPEGFPIDPSRAVRRSHASVERGAATFAFDGLPPGRYALALLNDAGALGKHDAPFGDRAVTFDGRDTVVRMPVHLLI